LAQAIFEWIEVFYNQQRRHSTLGMLDPVTYHQTSGRPCPTSVRCETTSLRGSFQSFMRSCDVASTSVQSMHVTRTLASRPGPTRVNPNRPTTFAWQPVLCDRARFGSICDNCWSVVQNYCPLFLSCSRRSSVVG
jgi:hypothetical protein